MIHLILTITIDSIFTIINLYSFRYDQSNLHHHPHDSWSILPCDQSNVHYSHNPIYTFMINTICTFDHHDWSKSALLSDPHCLLDTWSITSWSAPIYTTLKVAPIHTHHHNASLYHCHDRYSHSKTMELWMSAHQDGDMIMIDCTCTTPWRKQMGAHQEMMAMRDLSVDEDEWQVNGMRYRMWSRR